MQGWGFLEALGREEVEAERHQEVHTEAGRGHDVYLFPTRYLVTMVALIYELEHLVGCVWGCLSTSYLHTRYWYAVASHTTQHHQGASSDPIANTTARAVVPGTLSTLPWVAGTSTVAAWRSQAQVGGQQGPL